MIIIWDNGYDYSGHALYFVDTLDYDIDDCIKLLENWRGDGFLVAKAHDIEWFGGGAANIDELISFWSLKNKKVIHDINSKTLRGFFKKWKEYEDDLLERAKENEKWYQNVKTRHDKDFKYLETVVENL